MAKKLLLHGFFRVIGRGLSLPLVGLICLVLSSGCGDCNCALTGKRAFSPTPVIKIDAPPPKGRRVVLVVVDALRADRLGCYGYKRQPTTPTIDRLAGEGVLFEKFYAASPWTAPSFGSILTGVSPEIHRNGKWLRNETESTEWIGAVALEPLNPAVSTLAELLEEKSTAAFITNTFLHEKMGFARGFDHYDYEKASLKKSRRADVITDATVAWLKKHSNDEFFVLVHYFDPHVSYDPPPQYLKMFAPEPKGRVTAPFPKKKKVEAFMLGPTSEEKDFIKGLYNGEVRFVDDQLGRLVESMKQLGMLDDTWLVVTSDHGEEHYDHGAFDHGHRFEDEVMRVPLIIRPPGGKWAAGIRIGFSCSHVDLMPTILEWFSIDLPEYLEGRSLMPMITAKETSHRAAYMEYNLYGKYGHAYYDGRYKIIKFENVNEGFMYDVDEDPLEKEKLGSDHPAFVKLNKAMEEYRGNRPLNLVKKSKKTDAVILPKDVEESLRNLGYLDEIQIK
ncbi:MAG: sulfatase-like hydrolase/transferase [Proteobacteria bacterium]|nr:sulfatase-like hydrolase/transferase [Pseudomonadota bacterium]